MRESGQVVDKGRVTAPSPAAHGKHEGVLGDVPQERAASAPHADAPEKHTDGATSLDAESAHGSPCHQRNYRAHCPGRETPSLQDERNPSETNHLKRLDLISQKCRWNPLEAALVNASDDPLRRPSKGPRTAAHTLGFASSAACASPPKCR